MSLKSTLLELGCFESCEYLDMYVELIESNRNTTNQRYITQVHHIIPRCYYKINNLKVDNSRTNSVNLAYKDHIKAHILLGLMSKKSSKMKVANY